MIIYCSTMVLVKTYAKPALDLTCCLPVNHHSDVYCIQARFEERLHEWQAHRAAQARQLDAYQRHAEARGRSRAQAARRWQRVADKVLTQQRVKRYSSVLDDQGASAAGGCVVIKVDRWAPGCQEHQADHWPG